MMETNIIRHELVMDHRVQPLVAHQILPEKHPTIDEPEYQRETPWPSDQLTNNDLYLQ